MRLFISRNKYLFLKDVEQNPRKSMERRARTLKVSRETLRYWAKEFRDRDIIRASKSGTINILSLSYEGKKLMEKLAFFENLMDIESEVVM